MARVLTFSRTFPAYHPKVGQPTDFVEKVWKSLDKLSLISEELDECINNYYQKSNNELARYNDVHAKYHTIRAGNRWKVVDKFSPRVWSGKPYNSKQIIIAPDIEIKKVFDFEIKDNQFIINGKLFYHQYVSKWHDDIERLAKNDGLTMLELFQWFKFPNDFKGQIICWNDKINY
jgi:hypothetical protein